jgi:tRNA(Ser,Leu) C12 N-acetylase TAN1
MRTIIIRSTELSLKGKNKADFERQLRHNIKRCLKSNKVQHGMVRRSFNRIFVEDCGVGFEKIKYVFGISSFSPSLCVRPEEGQIKQAIDQILVCREFSTFRISAKKIDNSIAEASRELNMLYGSYVHDKYCKKVQLKDPDLDIGIEFLHGKAYVFCEKIKGPGGLPSGCEGLILVKGSSERSLFTAWLMMKRGCMAVLPDITMPLDNRFAYFTGFFFSPQASLPSMYKHGSAAAGDEAAEPEAAEQETTEQEAAEQKERRLDIKEITAVALPTMHAKGTEADDAAAEASVGNKKNYQLILRPLVGFTEPDLENKLLILRKENQ